MTDAPKLNSQLVLGFAHTIPWPVLQKLLVDYAIDQLPKDDGRIKFLKGGNDLYQVNNKVTIQQETEGSPSYNVQKWTALVSIHAHTYEVDQATKQKIPQSFVNLAIARIKEIDKSFADAGEGSWGSWMTAASGERRGLVRDLNEAGYPTEHKHVQKPGGGID